jgi:hypothetical protein
MKNTTELRTELTKVFEDLRNRKINTDEARSFVSISNSMVRSAIAEGNYNRYLENNSPIPFLATVPQKDKKCELKK